MNPLNTIFDKVFVLTIERNRDRHPQVEAILEGVNFEYWYGYDIQTMFPGIESVYQIPQSFFDHHEIDKEFAKHYTRGQLGVYLSVKKMMEYISEQKLSQVLLFEDDFLPKKKDWQLRIQKAMRELPADYHVFLLGFYYASPSTTKRWLRPVVKLLKNIHPMTTMYSTYLDIPGDCTGGHAYVVSRAGADYLRTFYHPMQLTGDLLLAKLIREEKVNAYSIYPCLFDQDTKKFKSTTRPK